MKKTLLLSVCFLFSLLTVAQTVNDNFTLDVLTPHTDNMMEFTFRYKNVNNKTTFQIYKYLNNSPEGELSIEFKSTERIQENQEPTQNTVYSCYLDGLDIANNTSYKIGLKAIVELETGEIMEELVYFNQPGGQFNGVTRAVSDLANATEYRFTYGLPNAPVLSEKKSSSAKLTWQTDQCRYGLAEFYTIFDRTSNKVIATIADTTTNARTEISYIVTNLIPGQNYDLFIRAYKDGNYLSTSPSVFYTPESVDCVTFISGEQIDRQGLSLQILGYQDAYLENAGYELYMGEEMATDYGYSPGGDVIVFYFASNIDTSKEFKLVTKNAKTGNKAIGLFKLKADGFAIDTQSCDIVFDLKVSHETQYTATLIWTDPGFTATKAAIEIINLDKDPEGKYPETIKIANPRVSTYTVGSLEHSTNYKFILKLSDDYNNQAKAEVKTKTKVGSICELNDVTSVSWLGCDKNGQFLAPYDVEFYTDYENSKPIVTVRFKLNSTDEINNVKLYYAPDGNIFTTLFNIKSLDMKKGVDGWYSASFDKLSGVNDMNNRRFYFSVAVTPAKRCGYLTNFYLMKPVAYQVGIGCQDEEVFTIISFDKTYEDQSQFTLKTNGRMASVGVFPEEGYIESTGEFIIEKRMFYNNFDDAPSEFTLDISDFSVGKYYMHIHDVYGEAEDLKYLWAIY